MVCGCVLGLSLPLVAGRSAAAVQVLNSNITEAEVLAAQKGWCEGLLKISAAYASGGFAKAKTTAEAVIDQAYAYKDGAVAFRPTLAPTTQAFRTTPEGALAYFVGGNPDFPKDTGFALSPWRSCQVKNQVIRIGGNYATTMGNVMFTNASGKTTTVDKTWGFMKLPDGRVVITLHHSSLPAEY